MNLLGGLCTFLFVGLLFTYNNTWDVHWPPWFIMTIIPGLVTAVALSRALNKWPIKLSVIWFYFYMASVSWATFRPLTSGLDQVSSITIRAMAAHGALYLLGVTWLFLSLNYWRLRWLIFGVWVFGLLHLVNLIYTQMPWSQALEKGLLGNRSMGASFLVISAFFFGSSPWYLALIFGACLLSHSIISSLALMAGVVGLVFLRVGAWARGLIVVSLAVSGTVIVAATPPWMYENVARFVHWNIFLKEWWNGPGRWFGLGAGAAQYWVPTWQYAHFTPEYLQAHGYWLWVHNDWLEFLFEFGVVGSVLGLVVFGCALKSSRNEPNLFASLIAIAVVMMGNYPWQIAATTLLCSLVLFCTFTVAWRE